MALKYKGPILIYIWRCYDSDSEMRLKISEAFAVL